MKKLFLTASFCALMLIACGGDNGTSSSVDEGKSSSVDEVGSSSSTEVVPDPEPESSSSSSVRDGISYGTLTDSRDNQIYKTVVIGAQTWMAENLNYDYNEGTAKSYCYDDESSNCDKYGRLYLWSVAMVVCPEGWHLPSMDEWKVLFDAVDGNGTAGMKLKSTSGWHSDGNGTDDYGFAVLPVGYRDSDDDYANEDYFTYFWSSTESKDDRAYSWIFYYASERADLGNLDKSSGFSVRCLRDLD